MKILAIDPGNVFSAWALIDAADCRPLDVGKALNEHVRALARYAAADLYAVEMIASYGMAVGKTVFDTCVNVGRLVEVIHVAHHADAQLVYRADVKLHLCHSSKAKDANITQALIDRFASGAPNRGKGTKRTPGWFHGFAADIWAAYAVAVYVADTNGLD